MLENSISWYDWWLHKCDYCDETELLGVSADGREVGKPIVLDGNEEGESMLAPGIEKPLLFLVDPLLGQARHWVDASWIFPSIKNFSQLAEI